MCDHHHDYDDVISISVVEAQYADISAVSAQFRGLRSSLTAFTRAYEHFGLFMNTKKAKLLYQLTLEVFFNGPSNYVSNIALQIVKYFSYQSPINYADIIENEK